MIYVERNEGAPASLSSQAAITEIDAAAEYYDNWQPGDAAFQEFTHYRGLDVHAALKRIFSWKCAYCEKQLEKGTFEVEHYRPKGGIADCNNHPGYWWLALAWTNLLPTCGPCNKGLRQHVVTADMTVEQVEALQATQGKLLMGKATQFPVGAARLLAKVDDHFAEEPHLIDPARTDPEPELNWRHDCAFSIVEPATVANGSSALGEATISCVALNRIDLVVMRTKILNRLRIQRIKIMEELELNTNAVPPAEAKVHLKYALRMVDDMKLSGANDQQFAGMVRAFVRKFADDLNDWAISHHFDVSAAPQIGH